MWHFPHLFVTIHATGALINCICFNVCKILLYMLLLNLGLWADVFKHVDLSRVRAFWSRLCNTATEAFCSSLFLLHGCLPKIPLKSVVHYASLTIVAARLAVEIIAWRATEGLDLFSLMPQTPNFTTSFHARPYPPLMVSSNVTPSMIALEKTLNISFEITSSVGFETARLMWKTPSGEQFGSMPVQLDLLSSPYHAHHSVHWGILRSWFMPGNYVITLEVRDFSCNTFEASLGVATLPSRRPPKDEGLMVWLGQALGIFKDASHQNVLDELPLVRNNAGAKFIAVGATDPKCWTMSYTGLFYTHCFLHFFLYYICLPMYFWCRGVFLLDLMHAATLPHVTAYQSMLQCSHCLTANLKPDDPCLVRCRNGHSIHRGCLDHLISRQRLRAPGTSACNLDVTCPACRCSTAARASHHFKTRTLRRAAGGAGGIGASRLLSSNAPLARVSIELFAAKERARVFLRMMHRPRSMFAEHCDTRLFVTAFAFTKCSHRSRTIGSMQLAVIAITRLSCSGTRQHHRKFQENVFYTVLARVKAGQLSKTHEALRHQGLQLVSSSNCALAAKAFTAGSVLGSTRCMAELSWMLCNGRLGVKKDGKEAFRLASRGVQERNCPDCMAALSKCLADGVGCEQNFERSIQFAHDSAEAGSRLGQYQLGALNYDSNAHISHKYNRVQIPAMNTNVAVRNFNLAAAQNMSSALCKLGHLREIGCAALSVDRAEAIRLYRAASAQGHPSAYYRLALCYERGRGVPADRDSAIDMYIRAQETGFNAVVVRDHLLRLGVNPPPLPPGAVAPLDDHTNVFGADLVMSLFNVISKVFTFLSYPWFAATQSLGKKTNARIKFILSASILVPFCWSVCEIHDQFAQKASVVPHLLMMSPWVLAACTLARQRIKRIVGNFFFGSSRLLDCLFDWCYHCGLVSRNFGYVGMWMTYLGDISLGCAWQIATGKFHHEFAWSDPPYDFFIFARCLLRQIFACCTVFYLHSLLLDSL